MTPDDVMLAAWLAPDAAPAEDALAVHERLRAEIDKLGAAHAQPDWAAVETLAGALLRGPRKDLRVASYLAHARTATAGAAGLLLGLRLLTELLRLPSDALRPTQPRARGRALAWYLSQTEAQRIAPADVGCDLPTLRAALEAFDAASREGLGDEAPSCTGLRAWLTARPAAPEIERACAEAVHAASPQRAVAPPQLPEPKLDTPVERAVHLAALGRALVQNGRARFAADTADAGAYRVRRLGAALACERVPAANKHGRSELDPPPASARATVHAAVQAARWDEVIATVEPLLDDCPLWIEGHHLSAQALGQLGPRHAAAHAVVVREARALVARLVGVETLRFADGSPLASDEARRWAAPAVRSAPDAGARAPSQRTPEAGPQTAEPQHGACPLAAAVLALLQPSNLNMPSKGA